MQQQLRTFSTTLEKTMYVHMLHNKEPEVPMSSRMQQLPAMMQLTLLLPGSF